MKLIFVFLLLSSNLVWASQTYAQITSLNLDLKNVSLEEVFDAIRKQSEFEFFYNNDQVSTSVKVSVNAKNADIHAVLEQALPKIYEYKINDRYILVNKRKETSPVLSPQPQQQSKKTITGVITDNEGTSIIGANIVEKGTTNGTVTDIDGKFSLQVADNAVIQISYIGYISQEINTTKKSTFEVVLQEDTQSLEELVVVGMNFRQTKRSVTGAMSTIQTKELKQSPVANLNNVLAGRVPGLMTVQASGEPGADAAAMYIRGVATYGSNKAPLIVIDGLPRSEGSFSQIDPNEVESVSILKDASSSALYGIQGANGVIVVTTKRGRAEQKPTIDFTSQTGLLQVTRLPEQASTYEYGTQYAMVDAINRGVSTPFTPEVIRKLEDGTADPYMYPNINWMDEILKPSSMQQQININISGSSNIVRYFVSGSYLHQGTILKHQNTFFDNYGKQSGFNRYNFRSNVDIRATERLNVQVDLAGRLENRTGPSSGFENVFNTLRWISPYSMAMFNPDGSLGMGSALQVPYWQNVYGLVTQSGYYENSANAMYGTISAIHDLDFVLPGLSLQGFFSFENNNISNTRRTQNFDSFTYQGLNLDGRPVYTQRTIASTLSTGGSNQIDRSTYIDLRLMYQKEIVDHKLTIQVLGNRTLRTINQELPNAYQGISGRFGYGYLNRYFVESNLGYNGSENFPKDRRYGFFPSASIAWIASDESFLENIYWLKYFKVRGSYGVAGNDKIGGQRWLYLTDFAAGGGYGFGVNPTNRPGYNESRVGNPFVTWERSQKMNAGFEARLLQKEMISLSFDIFQEKRTNILTPAGTVPDYLGITNLSPLNSGIVENKGIDGELSFRKWWRDWNIHSNVQFTYAKNKVIQNDQPSPEYPYQDLRGYEVGYQLGYKSMGLFRDYEDIQSSPKQFFDNGNIPGDIKYVDINQNGEIDPGDRIPIRMSTLPRFTGGFSLGLGYKGIDVSVLLNGALGGMATFKPNTTDRRTLAKVWTEENKDNARHPVPKEGLNNSMNATDFWLTSVDYLKLRNAEIGYVLPSFVRGIDHMRIFINGQNLAIWDKLWVKDRDPEATTGPLTYPIQRVFNAGINIRF